MLKKIVIVFLFLTLISSAETIRANYSVSYGIFGKIGVAKAVLTRDAKHYTIDIALEATGLAKVLSGKRKEHHISKGHIENGLMVSDLYQVIKSHGDVVVNKEYWINHKKRYVRKKYVKYKKGKKINVENTKLDFYAKNDLLTLYFNLDFMIKNKTFAKTYIYKAVGAERQKGKVSVIIPQRKDLASYKKDLGNDAAWYATAVIHQKIFSSKDGRLKLAIAKDGITNKAVLKDVIFFGDISAVRTK
ncbi:hypothetical protein MNB_SV-3-569 [hydrothermal vent metagenome]|uniref:DUF3108 domain-containing protein n=1 Tax=hydrothermal vent metagenome TaxID=652676 RepID=A0A1W1CUW9_9ZZZZ